MKAALQAAAALGVNIALFLLIARTNVTAKAPPVREAWTIREVFIAAPPPRPALLAEAVPRVLPDEPRAPSPATPVESAETPAPESFAPRLDPVPMDLGGTRLPGGPPVPLGLGRGGSLEGIPGGAAGGVPGGTGRGAQFRLSQVDRGPQRAVTTLPPYPHWARVRKLEGAVALEFTVDEEGAVRDVVIENVEGDDRFGPVALQAVAAWKYEPAVVGGKKVAVRLSQRVRFVLTER